MNRFDRSPKCIHPFIRRQNRSPPPTNQERRSWEKRTNTPSWPADKPLIQPSYVTVRQEKWSNWLKLTPPHSRSQTQTQYILGTCLDTRNSCLEESHGFPFTFSSFIVQCILLNWILVSTSKLITAQLKDTYLGSGRYGPPSWTDTHIQSNKQTVNMITCSVSTLLIYQLVLFHSLKIGGDANLSARISIPSIPSIPSMEQVKCLGI